MRVGVRGQGLSVKGWGSRVVRVRGLGGWGLGVSGQGLRVGG